MYTFVFFIISLILITLLFIMKGFEIYHGRKIFLERQFENFDSWIARILVKIKFWWSHVNFRNTKLFISWIVLNTKKIIVSFKRRFDHKQSNFFIKRNHSVTRNKDSVSFFLKNVSEYKRSLREENEGK